MHIVGEDKGQTDYKKRVGNGFWLPHRDFPFNEAYEKCDGKQSGVDSQTEVDDTVDSLRRITVHGEQWRRRVASVWLPVGNVTLDSGCMYVLPKEFDPDFHRSDSEDHLRAAVPGRYASLFS